MALRLKQSGWHVCCGLTTYVFPRYDGSFVGRSEAILCSHMPASSMELLYWLRWLKRRADEAALRAATSECIDQYHHWAIIS